MKITSKGQEIIEYQFDTFCKKVLRNEARDIHAENKRWNKKHVSLEDLLEIDCCSIQHIVSFKESG